MKTANCRQCGKPEDDPRHIKYGNDHDNPRKHLFEPEARRVPRGPFVANQVMPEPWPIWHVSAEGDTYGPPLGTEADAKAWAAAMNDAHEAGYASGQNDLQERMVAFQRELESLRSFRRSVDEALNSGDGSYRP